MESDVIGRIHELIDYLGCSQSKLAENCGISQSNINKMLKGTQTITPRTLRRITDAYQVNYDWLRKGIGDMFNEDMDKGRREFNAISQVDTGDDAFDPNKDKEQLVREIGELRRQVAELKRIIDEKDKTINALSSAIEIVNAKLQDK